MGKVKLVTGEPLDMELSRVPCNRQLADLVKEAAKNASLDATQWRRRAYREQLKREGYVTG